MAAELDSTEVSHTPLGDVCTLSQDALDEAMMEALDAGPVESVLAGVSVATAASELLSALWVVAEKTFVPDIPGDVCEETCSMVVS